MTDPDPDTIRELREAEDEPSEDRCAELRETGEYCWISHHYQRSCYDGRCHRLKDCVYRGWS
jgi:hypothetical protein